MKKLLSLVLAFVMICSVFAGCGSNETTETGASGESAISTVTPGKLTVATSPDFAPYEFYALDENGEPTLAGFDMALAQYIADYMGLELEVIPMDFDGTISELGAKKVDLSMAGYSPDPDRENAMDFSDVYYTGGQSFVSSTANKDLFTDLASANNAEYQIGAQIGSIQYELALTNTPDADIVQLSKVTDIVAEVINGKLHGAFVETVVAETYAKNYPDLVVLFEVPYDQEGSVVGVSKGNEALLNAVNEAIAQALEDGSMAQFVAEANELASGATYEGLLDEDGNAPTE